MENEKNKYSLIIIGAGPAGLTASIYASRYRMDNLVLGEALGGLAFEAHKICNFPTEQDISGMEIIEKMQKHAQSLGSRIIADKVNNIGEEGGIFKITTQSGKIFLANAVILATGTKYRRLDLPNEKKFLGKGVSYCATCDAMFYKDKIVAVIGGSDSATTSSLYLAELASKVYQIYRRNKLRGDLIWIGQAVNNKKIEIIYNTQVVELKGSGNLEKIVLSNPYKGKKEILVDGLFIEIGTTPTEALIKELSLKADKKGYIEVDSGQATNRQGVWAAGDITSASNGFRQIITACSEGAIAAQSAFKFLQQKK